MARITHVKKAQPRFKTVPVISSDGSPKVVAMKNKDGSPKTTKHGREVTMRVTVADRSQPLPLLVCGYCGKDIEIGTPYKHISPRSGPYGGRQLNRHEGCPTWQVWEYSSSLSSRIAQIQHDHDFSNASWESPDDVTSDLEAAAEDIKALAEEKRDAADSLESGFGHETEQSSELASIADDLENWADELEQADIPELPEPEETECAECEGTGKVETADSDDVSVDMPIVELEDCSECGGTGQVTPDVPSQEQLEAWLEEARDAAQSILDESPV